MRIAVEAGQTNHAYSMKGVVDQCREHLGQPRETIFFEPFKQMANITDEEEATQLQELAVAAIQTSVQPGFQAIISFLQEEYLPATRPNTAVSSLPGNGKAFYEACLAFHTSTNLTA